MNPVVEGQFCVFPGHCPRTRPCRILMLVVVDALKEIIGFITAMSPIACKTYPWYNFMWLARTQDFDSKKGKDRPIDNVECNGQQQIGTN